MGVNLMDAGPNLFDLCFAENDLRGKCFQH